MKETPPADEILTYLHVSPVIELDGEVLLFKAAASDKVIKLIGYWPCTRIYADNYENITLDLSEFDAPNLNYFKGNDTLDIYNWNFERTYAPDETEPLLTSVRHIYNSEISVSRPNPAVLGPIPIIANLYGKMAFCDIRLTDAPSGWQCIGSVHSDTKICSNNELFPDGISTAPCPDLTVVMSCPVSTVCGSPLKFVATATKSAEFEFYLDGVLQLPPPAPGLRASFTPDDPVAVGPHTVKVIATSGSESEESETTCKWIVEPPLEVTLIDPPCPVSTLFGSSTPTFTAKTNKLANFVFYLDDDPKKFNSGTEGIFKPNALPLGTYTVKVIATIGNERSEAMCEWTVVGPPLEVTLECPGPTVFGSPPPTFTAEANQLAYMTIYLDGIEILNDGGTRTTLIRFTLYPDMAVGTYTVKVVAQNENGEGSDTCEWTVVEPPPVVTMDCPGSSVIDPIGSSRTFSATISAASEVTVTFIPEDNLLDPIILVTKMVDAEEEITFSIDTGTIGEFLRSELVGTHTIQVVATNSSGSGSATCSLTLVFPWPALSMEYPGSPSEVGSPPTFTASTDRSAEITITVKNSASQVIATDSGVGTSFSFTPQGIGIGEYTVYAVVENEFELSNEVCGPWVVVDKFLIWKVTPDREVAIDALIDGWAVHRFKAQSDRNDPTLTLAATYLDDGSNVVISNRLGPSPTYPDTTETTLAVDKAGKYRITASTTLQGAKSVSWDWLVGEQLGSCSTVFLSDEGLYLHICKSDLMDILDNPENFEAIPENILKGLFLKFLTDALEKAGWILASTALRVIGKMMTCLPVAVVILYGCAHNPEDGSLDIFIPTTSLELIPVEIGSQPVNMSIRIGGYYISLMI
jgi:hypothetical protein